MNRRIRRSAIAVAAFVFVVTCASTSSTAPKVTIKQKAAPPNFELSTASGVPVEFRLTIDNPLDHAVTLLSVEVETVGSSGAYQMNRVRQRFSQVVAAQSSETIDFRAWVQPLSRDQRGDINSPVLLRGTAKFQADAGVISANFSGRGQ